MKDRAPRVGMSTAMAAKYLGVAPNTLRTWSDRGHIQCHRTPGNQRRYRRTDLDRFLNDMNQQGEKDNEVQ